MVKAFLKIAVAVVIISSCKKEEPAPEPVPDTTKPTITMKGKSQDTISLNSIYADPGATASDDTDGDISSHVAVTGTVDKDRVGGNYLYYTVTDAAGNSAQATRYVYVRNDAYIFTGMYNVVSNCGGNFTGLNSTAEVTTSTSKNNQISITKQQFQSAGFNVSVVMGVSSLTMFTQPIGSSLGSGTGPISSDKKSFTITTTYNPPIQGSSGCTIVYSKQ